MKNILLIIFLSSLLLAGCSLKTPIAAENKTIDSGNFNNDEINTNPLAGWQTYSDSKYGINFKHPTDWECKIVTDQTPSPKAADRVISCSGNNASMFINIMTVFNESGPIEWLKDNYGITKEVPETLNYEVAGTKGIKYSYTEGNPPTIPENEGIKLVFIKSKKLFNIYCHVDEKGEQKNNIENILKSIIVD